MNCTLCHNGVTQPGLVTVTLEKKGTIVLIKNVPAELCSNCGHYYLSEEMAKEAKEKVILANKLGVDKALIATIFKLTIEEVNEIIENQSGSKA